MIPRPDMALIASMVLISVGFNVGCGFGPGQERGSAEVLITRDYGRVAMYEGSETLRDSDDAMRLLTRSANQVETAYGGGFVESIDGYGSDSGGGSQTDWFFYIDGIESPVGALEASVEPGESIWWDRRDWSETMHVPAVVGSWPRPFGSDSPRVRVECQMPAQADCAGLISDLVDTGARVSRNGDWNAPFQVLVGPWSALRRSPMIASIERGPAASGVYARFEPDVRGSAKTWVVQPLDSSGEPVGPAQSAGLVAALSDGPEHVIWVVTGSDPGSVPRHLSRADLAHRYAVIYPGHASAASLEIPRP